MPLAPGDPSLPELRAKDPAAVERVIRDHTAVLLRGALALGLPESEAEELVQDTLATFLEAAARFEGRSSVRTFLFGILYRKGMERGRKRARELATDPADALFEGHFDAAAHWNSMPRGPEKDADVKEIAALIALCLEELPPQQKAAFLLREVDREETDSICNALDVSDTHLRVLLFRARNRLRECLERKWAQP